MRTIFKYPLVMDAVVQTVEMPKDAIILSAGMDPHNNICIWAMVDTEEETEKRKVFIFGTGWDVTDFIDAIGSMDFIDTVKSEFYMWHLFIDSKEEEFDLAAFFEEENNVIEGEETNDK